MSRIKITDIPSDFEITKKDLREIRGGVLVKPVFQSALPSIDWGNLTTIAGYCQDGSSKPSS